MRNLDGSDVLGRSIPLGRYPIIPIVTDGQLAYVDLASNRTVLLDLATDQEVARIPSSYNGIHGGNPGSLWGGFHIVHVAGGGWSYYRTDGEPIRDAAGHPRVFTSPRRSAGGFSEGLAPYQDPKRRLTGFIDTKGHWAIPPLYQAAWGFQHGLARVARTEEDRARLIATFFSTAAVRWSRPITDGNRENGSPLSRRQDPARRRWHARLT